MEKIIELLLNEEFIDALLFWQALILPILCTLIGLIWGVIYGNRNKYLVRGLSIGLAGPIILVLWIMYNSITDSLGLDTVKNLITNLLLFIIIGIILGFFYRIVFYKTTTT